jgi:nucleotide-binding universal stress UspA family protein
MAIQTAAELAAALGGEIVGLFVEEKNLFRMAEFPFAREVGGFLTACTRLDSEALERALRAQAQRMFLEMEAAAGSVGVPWEFRVVRGTAPEELLSAAAEADLVVIGKIGRSLGRRRRLGSTTRVVVSRRRGLTMIVHEIRKPSRPITVVYDGSDESKHALDAARLLAEVHEDTYLRVVVVADSRESGSRLQSEVKEQVRVPETEYRVETQVLVKPSTAQLTWFLQTDGGGPVVIACNTLGQEDLCAAVNEIQAPVLLVGERNG